MTGAFWKERTINTIKSLKKIVARESYCKRGKCCLS